jgi:hypothetical protein
MDDDNGGGYTDVLSSLIEGAASSFQSYEYNQNGYAGNAPVLYGPRRQSGAIYGNPGFGLSGNAGSSSMIWIVLAILISVLLLLRKRA